MNALKRCSILALVVLAACAQAQDKKTIRLNVKPGTVMTSTSVTDGKFAMTGPADQTVNNKTTMVQQYKFDAGSEGWMKFLIETTDFKMEGEQFNMGTEINTDQIIAQAKKVKISGEVNNVGAARNVVLSGADDMEMGTKQMMSSISDRISQIGLLSMYFPDEGVTVGTTWKKEIDLAKSLAAIPFFTDVNGKAPVEFTVEGFENVEGKDTAKIKVFLDGRVTFGLNFGGGGDSKGNMSTTSSSHVWIDLATGLPVKSDTKMANNIDFGMGTMQQEMSVTTTTTVKDQ